MKRTSLFLFVFALIAFAGLAFAEARDGFSASSPEALILDPGMASSCQNDFIIENMDGGEVDLKIVLGNEEWRKDTIKAMESKAYGLQASISQAHLEGKNVFSSDVATIFNTDEMARIRLHCVE